MTLQAANGPRWRLEVGDMREVLAAMEPDSIDACLTDPPYELGFMGKAWDSTGVAFDPETWRAVWRVLKPGAHLLAFGGTRTVHRIACAIEDAGFDIRDQVMWLYGSGFPKSLDVSKAIDKRRDDSAAGLYVGAWLKARREARGLKQKEVAALWPSVTGGLTGCVANWETLGKVPKWDQWLELKGFIGFGDEMDAEVWRLNGRKGHPGEAWHDREVVGEVRSTRLAVAPGQGEDRGRVTLDMTRGSTDDAKRWEGWGTATRPSHEPIVVARKPLCGTVAANVIRHGTGALHIDAGRFSDEGRWPANVIASEEAAAVIEQQSPGSSAFFYVAKPTRGERDAGLEHLPVASAGEATDRGDGSAGLSSPRAGAGRTGGARNIHPTVKPIDLGRYLSRLITPPGGTVLDCFAGSGGLMVGPLLEGFHVVGVEMETPHAVIAHERLRHWEGRSIAPTGKARRASVTTTPDLFAEAP